MFIFEFLFRKTSISEFLELSEKQVCIETFRDTDDFTVKFSEFNLVLTLSVLVIFTKFNKIVIMLHILIQNFETLLFYISLCKMCFNIVNLSKIIYLNKLNV